MSTPYLFVVRLYLQSSTIPSSRRSNTRNRARPNNPPNLLLASACRHRSVVSQINAQHSSSIQSSVFCRRRRRCCQEMHVVASSASLELTRVVALETNAAIDQSSINPKTPSKQHHSISSSSPPTLDISCVPRPARLARTSTAAAPYLCSMSSLAMRPSLCGIMEGLRPWDSWMGGRRGRGL